MRDRGSRTLTHHLRKDASVASSPAPAARIVFARGRSVAGAPASFADCSSSLFSATFCGEASGDDRGGLTSTAAGSTLEMMGTKAEMSRRLAGRARELGLLTEALDEAVDGVPRGVVVRGEAGVGKTRLGRAGCAPGVERGLSGLWGTCVRFGAIESTFLPWVMAVERWLASATEPDVQQVLGEVPEAGQLLPSLGGSSATDAARLMGVLKSLISFICVRHPTVLVM